VADEVNPHSYYSSRREKLLESLFAGEVLRELWRRGIYEVDLLHSDIDASGYDIVLEISNEARHIQLKASTKRKQVVANAKVSDRPSGCIIVMIVSEDTLSFKEFLWFGNRLGKPCSDVRTFPKARHSKADSAGIKANRQDTYKVSVGKFERVKTFASLVDKLIE
jgi:hypothetical protein